MKQVRIDVMLDQYHDKMEQIQDELEAKTNVWKKVQDVEFKRYRDRLKMKQLGMMKKNGDYNYDAFKKYMEDKSSWIDLTQSQDEDED